MYIFIIKNIFPQWKNKSNKFLIHVLILLLTTLSLSFIMISLSINRGFKSEVINKIIEVDGIGRYTKINDEINIYKNKDLIKQIETTFPQYIASEVEIFDAIIKYENKSEGVIFHAYDDNGIDVFNINQYINTNNINGTGVIVGEGLSQKNSLNIDDTITVVNFYSLDDIQRINIKNFKVSGIFKTDIPYYDNHVVYGHKSLIDTFNKKSFLSQIVVNRASNNNSHDLNRLNDYNINNYYFNDWKNRHNHFIYWLHTYDGPIKILLLFIFLVSMLSIFSYVFIDLNIRKNDTMIFYLLGMNLKEIKILYILKNIFISLFVGLLSLSIAIIILYMQKTFNFISLPSNIYILSSLPVSFNYQNFIITIPFVLITCFIASFISFKSYIRDNSYIELDELL